VYLEQHFKAIGFKCILEEKSKNMSKTCLEILTGESHDPNLSQHVRKLFYRHMIFFSTWPAHVGGPGCKKKLHF